MAAAVQAVTGASSQSATVDFQALFDTLPTAYLVMDRNLVIVAANRAYLTLLGRSREDLIGTPVFTAFPPAVGAQVDDHGVSELEFSFLRARDTGRVDVLPLYRYSVLDGEGVATERFWSLISAPLLNERGETELLLQRVEDITEFVQHTQRQPLPGEPADAPDLGERMRAAEAELYVRLQELRAARAGETAAAAELTQTQARAQAVLDTATDAILTLRSGRVESVNRSAEAMFGYPAGELVGFHMSTVLPDLPDPEPRPASGAAMAETVPGGVETVGQRRDGSQFPVELALSEVDAETALFTVIARDVTERARVQQQMTHQLLHDPLTGLANRILLGERLEHAVVRLRRHPGVLAVLFVDLDGFKQVNDKWGHPVGDQLLIATAGRLRQAARAEDLVARFGGDEFVIICEELASASNADIIAARLTTALTRPVLLPDGLALTPHASVGTITDTGHRTAAQLLHDADAAMYAAKRTRADNRRIPDPRR